MHGFMFVDASDYDNDSCSYGCLFVMTTQLDDGAQVLTGADMLNTSAATGNFAVSVIYTIFQAAQVTEAGLKAVGNTREVSPLATSALPRPENACCLRLAAGSWRCSLQLAAYCLQLVACSLRLAARSLQPALCSLRLAARSLPLAPCSLQLAAGSLQLATLFVRNITDGQAMTYSVSTLASATIRAWGT
jgi:hypothetical protein